MKNKFFNFLLAPLLFFVWNCPTAAFATENTYLDARAGSQSPWSLQFLLNYSGASLSTPLAADAPNPGHDPVPPRVQLGGSMSLRYRKDPRLSFGLGTGVQTDTPFHGAQNSSLSNPLVDLSWFEASQKIFLSLSAMAYTDPVYRSYFYQSNVALGISTTQNILDSKYWFWGLQLGLARNFFDQQQGYQLESSLGLYPSLSYQASKTLSLRTVLSFGMFQGVNSSVWMTQKLSQTLGLGWQPQRDLFFYGYALFNPSPFAELNSENSSLGLSLTLNVF